MGVFSVSLIKFPHLYHGGCGSTYGSTCLKGSLLGLHDVCKVLNTVVGKLEELSSGSYNYILGSITLLF